MVRVDSIDHVAFIVRDLDRSIAWYQDLFGMERRYQDVWTGKGDPALLCVSSTCVALFRSDQPEPMSSHHRNEHLALRADRANFERAQRELRERNIDFSVRDHTICHSIYFADPDGNNIELTTYEV